MLQQAPTPPSGPRGSSQSGRLTSSGTPNRGRIQKRKGASIVVDRDGDLVMDATAANGRGRGIGRGTAIRGSAQNRRHGTPEPLSPRVSTRPNRTGIDTSAIQKAVLRGMGSEEAVRKGPRSSLRSVRGTERNRAARDGYDKISVWGLKKSKAVSNPDGGIKDLLAFLERKATGAETPSRDAVKINKSRLEGDALIISVRPEDTPKILRLHHFNFAGATLKIEGPSGKTASLESNTDSETPDTIETLKNVLSRRYNVESKLLDLSQLGSDPQLVNIGMFNTTSRESKFFPALMKICDGIFTTAHEKEEAVVSVSLANNALPNIASITSLSQTFPDLKNLDLSNNQIKNLIALEGWRWKFRKLDHLILTGNPIETEEPHYKNDIMKWYPTLRKLNTTQIRSTEDIPPIAKGRLPLPILGPSFRDEASISETFVRQFFPAYDADRTALANGYYDAQSTFSLSINTSAPRALEGTTPKVAGWDQYIKRSRNLTKLTHTSAQMSRLYTGTESVRDSFTTLPATRHPDLLAEPQKWCIECHTIPGLQDPTGQSVSGVGGLIVTVHGEFFEVDVSNKQTTTIRSFDRTFVLGPGGGIGGIRVASDIYVLRAHGGNDAWKPEEPEASVKPTIPAQTPQSQVVVPEGFGVPGQGKSEEQVQKEALAVKLSKATGMTLEYSGLCLEQSAWSLEGAAVAFEQAKANLPAEAFVSA